MKLYIFTLFTSTVFALPPISNRQATPCDSEKVAQLSGGIQANLFVQKQELAG